MNSKEAGHTKPRVVSERQRNDRLHARLGSTTMQMKPKGKPKKDSKVAVSNQTRRTPHENAGIVSARQLDSIRTIVDGTQKRIPGDGKENQSDQVHSAIGPKFSYETNDDAIINSVMQQVARLNRDKLSEDSLVKVLTSVYLDAKSKLADKDRPASIRMDSNDQRMSRQVETTTNLVDDSRVNGRSLETDELRPSAAEQNLSFGERKKRQWEKERAELAALTAQDPWSKPNSASSSTAPQSGSAGPRVYVSSDSSPAIRSTVVDSVAWSGSDSALTTSNSNMFGSLHPAAPPPPPPALTPMAFAVHEDAELHKREEQRRQWKAELDRQVSEQRMLQEKQRLAEQRSNEALLQQMRFQQLDLNSSGMSASPLASTTIFDSNMSYPIVGPTEAHPSASHFAPAAFVPTQTLAPVPFSCASLAPQPPPPVSSSVSLASTVPLDSTAFGSVGGLSAGRRTAFNKTRGFTQQMYANSAEAAERARRAQEARMANLQQIEEKRRQREEEKARQLLEEKLEEERIAREQARLKAIADAEDAARLRKEKLDRQHVEQLHQSLFEARKAAEQEKMLRFAMHAPRPTPAPVVTASWMPTQCPAPDSSQSVHGTNTMGAPMFNMTSTVAPCMSVGLMPPQVPMVSSSGVQTASVEDAQVQTEPSRHNADSSGGPARSTPPRDRGYQDTNKPAAAATGTAAQTNHRGPMGNNRTGTQRPGIPATSSRRNETGTTTVVGNTGAQGRPQRPAASGTAGSNPGQLGRKTGRSGCVRATQGADVAESDYRRTAYAPASQSRSTHSHAEGIAPCHRPESRQRKHTGFTPPPELPEPQTRRRLNVGIRHQSEQNADAQSTNTSSPRHMPTRIPVPVTESRPDKAPTLCDRSHLDAERPIRGHDAAYLEDPLDRTGFGSVDLIRTHDVLNPLEANGSLPVSREPSASIQARNAYLKNSNPALYGDPPVQSTHPPASTKRAPIGTMASSHSSPTVSSGPVDPLLNPNMVRDHPTPRQDTILRHLSEIRKGLQLKQMLYESGNYDDEDD